MVLETDAPESDIGATSRVRVGIAAVVVAVLALGLIWAANRSAGPEDLPPAADSPAVPATPQLSDDRVVIQAGQQALAAWGEFAVTGDVTIVEPWFAPDGPQLGILAAEARELAADPLGPPAYIFTMANPEVVDLGVGERVMRGPVTITRSGEQPQEYEWGVELRWDPAQERWLVWTANTIEDL